jgi:hypothetical protein
MVLMGIFGGATFVYEWDYERLSRQAKVVWDLVSDGEWWTLYQLAEETNEPTQSISARLRDLRKPEGGSWIVERKRLRPGSGTHLYRLVIDREMRATWFLFDGWF